MTSKRYAHATAPLNARQRDFVKYYLRTGNATKAARLAGYRERAAANQGHRLLGHPQVRALLAPRQQESMAELAEEVARQLGAPSARYAVPGAPGLTVTFERDGRVLSTVEARQALLEADPPHGHAPGLLWLLSRASTERTP